MADEAASGSAPTAETVETPVLYIRDHILEWPDRVIFLRHIQSVSCETSEPPERPGSADQKEREGARWKMTGILLCILSGLFLAAAILFRSYRLQAALFFAGAVGLACGGAQCIRTCRARRAEAGKEIEKWEAACAEADKNRYLELVLSSGGKLRFSVGNPVFLQRVFQLLSSKLDNPEDPDRRYKIELDNCKLYRIRLVRGREPGRPGGERRQA